MPQLSHKTEQSWAARCRARLKRVRLLSYLLDEQFRLPGTQQRVGLDGLLGLIPGVGDALGMLLSTYILFGLMLDSGVLHTLERTEVLEMKRVFPRMLHRLRPSRKACKNNLLRQILPLTPLESNMSHWSMPGLATSGSCAMPSNGRWR